MGLKINGSTSGSIEIDVPAVAGTDTSITIPAKNGGTFIVEESTGNIDLGPLDINGSASDDSVNIDGSGRLLVGTSTATSSFKFGGSGDTATLAQFDGASSSRNVGLALVNHHTSDTQPVLRLAKSRGTAASPTVVSSNDNTGSIQFMGYDGTRYIDTARIDSVVDTTPGTNDMPGRLVFSTTSNGGSVVTERMRIANNGNLTCLGVYTETSASAANVFVGATGNIQRSTSSAKYKTDVEEMQDTYADSILQCRPVWYRSTCQADNPAWGWWGFIAEEVAEIDPRLVHWKTTEPVVQENGTLEHVPCDPEPEGVAYDRFVPHLLNLIKRQAAKIETLETANASLEARLTALEGGAS
jgi:hypothetical protein